MSMAAAAGSDGGDDGDNKGKGLAHGHEEEKWSPIRTNPVSSSDSDEDDDNKPTLKRKLSSSPRPGLSTNYQGGSKSFGDLTKIKNIAEIGEKEEHPVNKKRRLEHAAEFRKLEEERRAAAAAAATGEILPDAAVDQAAADEVLPDAAVNQAAADEVLPDAAAADAENTDEDKMEQGSTDKSEEEEEDGK